MVFRTENYKNKQAYTVMTQGEERINTPNLLNKNMNSKTRKTTDASKKGNTLI